MSIDDQVEGSESKNKMDSVAIAPVVDINDGLASGESSEYRWYVVHALTGHENKVAKSLKERIVNFKQTNSFSRILIPEETVVANVNGKKRNIKKKFFPGYILIKMILTDETWHLVRNTDKITGFLGGNKLKPTPISEEEAAAMLGQITGGFKPTKSSSHFSAGDSVKVTEGPFATFVGTIEQVDDNGKLKVNVSIFGRPTPVELDFSQVEKM
jgi:transcriptional antiterminator NusG